MQTNIAPLCQLIVVDDDLLYTRLVELVLKSLKFPGESRIFNNPTDLLPSLLSSPPPATEIPRLILLDLSMPQMNGFSLLKSLRADVRTKATPVVVMSGILEEHEVKEAYLNGANSCMRKPDELDGFFKVFDRLLEYWFSLSLMPKT